MLVGSVWVVDDVADAGGVIAESLRQRGWETRYFASLPELLVALQSGVPTIVLLDYHMDRVTGLDGLRAAVQAAAGTPVVLYTGDDIDCDPSLTGEAVIAGAEDVFWRADIASQGGARRLHSRLIAVRERRRRVPNQTALQAQILVLLRVLVHEFTTRLPAPRTPSFAERLLLRLPMSPDVAAKVARGLWSVVGAVLVAIATLITTLLALWRASA